jgi:hypothetical protein
MRGNFLTKRRFKKLPKLSAKKLKYFGLATLLILGTAGSPILAIKNTTAESCPDLKIIFARGSGGTRWVDDNYQTFKTTIEEKLATTSIDYEFLDLDYPDVAIGLDHIETSLGALVGGGDSYTFGESVDAGVAELMRIVNNSGCKNTRYVLGGYSQGAMVVSKSLGSLNSERIIYAATFGDPKIYLPEGKGIIPAACSGQNLSDYRAYVPDCQAYKGLLGAYIPYEPAAYEGKLGTWCNKNDIFCSSGLSVSDHLHYMADDLYEDASRVIFDKVTEAFNIENNLTSPHDTAILIDSTGSMESIIEKYKDEAYRLAKETLDSGGRVALYDYRDLKDPYQPVKHCDFSTCTLEVFESELAKIQANNGGDTPESLLSASFHVMKDLKWNYGSTKSLVVLTDADFLSPDRDGITYDEVVKLSKQIDPVNFYIITKSSYASTYQNLANDTDGKVMTNFDELSLLTDYIMERYDSLPKVEENENPEVKPTLEITNTEQVDENSIKINFTTDGVKTMIILNDVILGTTAEAEITLTDLNLNQENTLILVPMSETSRGESASITFSVTGYGNLDFTSRSEINEQTLAIPKSPKTGRQ